MKPNVGHLEAGAGAVGLVKAVLAFNKGILPPQTNLNKLNSKVNWDEAGVPVVQDATDWPSSDPIRRASICSYGYGGTVSHAVMEEFSRKISETVEVNGPKLLLISAPQAKGLAVQVATQQSWISSGGLKCDFGAIVTTLATRRGHHDYRLAMVVDNHEEAVECLRAFGKGSTDEWVAQGRVLASGANKDVVWVFSGHGAQWNDMGKDLLHDPVFHEVVASFDPIVEAEMQFSALKALESGKFDVTDKVQVLTYVMQVGLSEVLRSKGITPQAVIGHSVGEIAASVVAACLTPKEGALVVCRRAKLYRQVMGLGSMILVNTAFADVKEELRGRRDIVAAIDTSRSSCVVFGTSDAVSKFAESLKARGIETFRVKTDIAFHNPTLEKLVAPLLQALSQSLSPRPPSVMLYSTSDLDPRTQRLRDSQYWSNNMVNPVLLLSAVDAALEDGIRLFLEISTHPIVAHSISETLMDKGIEDFQSLQPCRGRTQWRKAFCSASRSCTAGVHWWIGSN